MSVATTMSKCWPMWIERCLRSTPGGAERVCGRAAARAASAGPSVGGLAAIVLALLFGAGPVQAWGPHGHQLVAEIAARLLRPSARREVERLLGDRADLAMREASTWPDTIRDQPGYRDTGPLHYNNFPRGQCQYRPQRDCRNGRCLVGAIERFAALLADSGAGDRKRAEALRFVIHFVGDIHQPLHAGWGDDRGGNDFQVRIGRDGRNLHSLWDDYLIRQAGLGLRAHRDQLERLQFKPGQLVWDRAAPARWVEESCRVIALGVYPDTPAIDRAYVERMRPVAERRIALAGQRLAVLLNALLGE